MSKSNENAKVVWFNGNKELTKEDLKGLTGKHFARKPADPARDSDGLMYVARSGPPVYESYRKIQRIVHAIILIGAIACIAGAGVLVYLTIGLGLEGR